MEDGRADLEPAASYFGGRAGGELPQAGQQIAGPDRADDAVLPRFGAAGGDRERREPGAAVADQAYDLTDFTLGDLADRSEVLDGDMQISRPDGDQTGLANYL